jgi:hypothetical protein
LIASTTAMAMAVITMAATPAAMAAELAVTAP